MAPAWVGGNQQDARSVSAVQGVAGWGRSEIGGRNLTYSAVQRRGESNDKSGRWERETQRSGIELVTYFVVVNQLFVITYFQHARTALAFVPLAQQRERFCIFVSAQLNSTHPRQTFGLTSSPLRVQQCPPALFDASTPSPHDDVTPLSPLRLVGIGKWGGAFTPAPHLELRPSSRAPPPWPRFLRSSVRALLRGIGLYDRELTRSCPCSYARQLLPSTSPRVHLRPPPFLGHLLRQQRGEPHTLHRCSLHGHELCDCYWCVCLPPAIARPTTDRARSVGLNSVLLADLTLWQQVILFVSSLQGPASDAHLAHEPQFMMCLGSTSSISVFTIMIRKYAFAPVPSNIRLTSRSFRHFFRRKCMNLTAGVWCGILS